MAWTVITILTAYMIDLVFGDPAWLPHPVKGIGYLAQKLEPPLRRTIRNERLAGVILAAVIVGSVYIICFTIIGIAAHFNRYLSFAMSALIIYTSLAIKDLKIESMRVYDALEGRKIELARKNLSMIVGRDTQNLNDKDVIRATVETVAENTVDGIVAPLFYSFLGGAPLALAYKAANTLDSMVGYKNKKYINFGWAAARIVDILNFIPARLAAIIMPIASGLAGLDAARSFKITLRDRRKNSSPNSGIPEAAIAGALGVRLGGLNFYNSVGVMKPSIGDDRGVLDFRHIKESVKVAYISAALTIIFGVAIIYIFCSNR